MTIEQALAKLGIDASCATKLNNFIGLFEKWNKSINLSAASSRGDLLGHVNDSLHVVPRLHAAKRVLDVGSGGGFPVVIAAICLPDVQFVSLEPVHKKHAFLRTAARELGLPNLDARAERLDDHADADYDAAMSRATFDLREWLEAGAKRVVPGGVVLGFEAVRRDDLPPTISRDAYNIDGKPRSIVVLPVSAAAAAP
ncbi:MAG: 16S rRNA (guanine(527)-N(7))-methyltransferase RsmG [Deltaproteobacteria bacterium]|nr:16S rRNA (guanine(527)-N(7))-methyltransferase RsmG [Deltaproteobacteria bacterium]